MAKTNGLPVIHLENLTNERERNLLIQTSAGFERAGVRFVIVDRDSKDKNSLIIQPINRVSKADIQAIADELFSMYADVEKVGVVNEI